MSYFRIWMHVVLITEGQEELLDDVTANSITSNIKAKAMEKGILVDSAGASKEHVHFLISLGVNQNVGAVIEDLKEIVSRMVNMPKLTATPLFWDDGYFAFSASHSLIDKVREYIKGQVVLHQRKTFQEEFSEFCEKHGFIIKR
ncbi:transposase [Williamwhitmania taraxaci]|uniref:Putative transposase n=1 Tax=Williamwhitmania taraxaci TaxID=1640674 RepID=A0A1G6HI09_9BACT|nr:transposase [Williamwhitmania taraxaci]SDB93841.1 putative transposase [Williamwhitmania taraxaci]